MSRRSDEWKRAWEQQDGGSAVQKRMGVALSSLHLVNVALPLLFFGLVPKAIAQPVPQPTELRPLQGQNPPLQPLPGQNLQPLPGQNLQPLPGQNLNVQPSPNQVPQTSPLQTQPPATKPAPPKKTDEFPPNPLESTTPDPLLPQTTVPHPLSALERKQLTTALDNLNNQAIATLRQGDRVGAFALWYRELRLRRSLGAIEETKALGRVGDVAWKENLTPDVRWITKRLDAILAQHQLPTATTATAPATSDAVPLNPVAATSSPNTSATSAVLSSSDRAGRLAVLQALGVAYQQVRLPKPAVAIYTQIVTDAKQRRDEKQTDEALITLAQLHLTWLDYLNAAATYQELSSRAKARGDRQNESIYLTRLAYSYEQAKQPAQAITAQQQLVALYETLPDPLSIPALKIKIADNYQLLARPDQAEQYYQSAYQLAQPALQLAYASEALQKLGALYRANDRLDAALKVFDYLVSLEQQSYNLYGMMHAYDQIGQIQRVRKQNQQALAAFQQGLGLARQLKYRQDYFTAQIQEINK
jgi:tetratricopeptide (TPR) repeat protein